VRRFQSLPCAVVLLFSAAMWASSIRADGISLSQTIDRTEMPFEEKAQYEIVLAWHGSQFAYRFDKPLQPTLEKLKVQEFSSTISSAGAGADEVTTKKFHYTLAPTSSGLARIEPVTISYVTWPDTIPGTLVTEEMSVNVATPAPVSKRAGNLPKYFWPLVAACGGVIVFGCTGIALAVRAKRMRNRAPEKTTVQVFLERLSQIKSESNGDLKRFQTALYKNLLWYLSAQYSFDFTGQSVEEIVKALDNTGVPEMEKDRVCGWLLRADREKFTPAVPTPGETIRLETEVREFFESLESTKSHA
jgi:hypothetical protein